MLTYRVLIALATVWLLLISPSTSAATVNCGESGTWIEILGAGGGELDDAEAAPGYVVWIDNAARLLVNAGPGTALRFEESGAKLADLDAVLFNQMGATHSLDMVSLIAGARGDDRREDLLVLGPEGRGDLPSIEDWFTRLIGPNGAFPHLAGALDASSNQGFTVRPRTVSLIGAQRWSAFGNDRLELSAIAVNHGNVPSIAWRVDTSAGSVVFAGSFNNLSNRLAAFAENADTIVFHHGIPQSARGADRDLHVVPSQIGRIAETAELRFVILGHRSARTRGVESLSRQAIEESFKGDLIFANDGECWGL